MTTRTNCIVAAGAAALLGGALLAAQPAQAQDSSWRGWSPQGGTSQQEYDWVQSRDFMDPYDRWLMQLRRQESPPSPPSADRRRSDRFTEQRARDAFERGYRAGREEERRRAMQGRQDQRFGADQGRSGPSWQRSGAGDRQARGGGGGPDVDFYWIVPDVLPDTPFYRGMQDFVLIPDYREPMERLLTAAQSLREAIQSTAQIPSSDRRDRAIDLLHEALIETQQAMVMIPPEQRTW